MSVRLSTFFLLSEGEKNSYVDDMDGWKKTKKVFVAAAVVLCVSNYAIESMN